MLTRQEYLNAMGIEVWTLRQQPDQVLVNPDPETVAAAFPERAQNEQAAQTTSPSSPVHTEQEPVPNFRLAMLHYQNVGLCLSLSENESLPRRFCDDIARVMGGDIDGLRFQMLEWPMLNTTAVDQSLSAARQVVTQKFASMPAHVLVFGHDVADYFGPLSNIELNVPGQVGNRSYLVIPSLAGLMNSGPAKRDLMTLLYSWVV